MTTRDLKDWVQYIEYINQKNKPYVDRFDKDIKEWEQRHQKLEKRRLARSKLPFWRRWLAQEPELLWGSSVPRRPLNLWEPTQEDFMNWLAKKKEVIKMK